MKLKPSGKTTPVVVRLNDELLAEVDAYTEHLRETSQPGLTITRTEAMRALLVAGLAASKPARRVRPAT